MVRRSCGVVLGMLLILILVVGSGAAAPVGSDGESRTVKRLPSADAGPGASQSGSHSVSANETGDPPSDGVLNDSHLPDDPAAAQQGRTDPRTTVILTASKQSEINTTALREVGATVADRHERFLEVSVPADAVERIRNLPWVSTVRPPAAAAPGTVSEGVTAIRAQQLHQLNVTGEGVRVGVITFGVDPTSPEYADNVVETQSFHPAGIRSTDPTHGTAVTEIVADTAPDAELYLTSYDGSYVTFSEAVSWLESKDVDVIVMSIEYYSEPDDGTGAVSRIATNATDAGIFWANIAGNAARKHWRGKYTSPDGDRFLNFDGEDELNALQNGSVLAAGTEVTLSIKWNDSIRSDDDYTIHLFNEQNERIASSSEAGLSRYPVELLTTTLPADGRYYFAIEGDDSEHVIRVTGTDNIQPLEYETREGSILAPGVAKGVTAVGAYSVQTGDVARYSSAGPTVDGRRGVDIIAPTSVTTDAYSPSLFSGTSAAAPHVGGAAALLLSVNDSASARDVETALMTSATDVDSPGRDIYTGAGKPNVVAAAETLDPAVPLTITANASTIGVNDTVAYQVTRADTGAPINATVTVGDRTYATNDDGQLLLTYVEAGTYTLTAETTRDPPTADFTPGTRIETVGSDGPALELAADNKTATPGDTVAVTYTVENVGAAEETSVLIEPTTTPGNVSVESVAAPAATTVQGQTAFFGELEAGGTYQLSVTYNLSDSIAPGTYALGARTEGNSGATDTVIVSLDVTQPGDVVGRYDDNDSGTIDGTELLDALADYPDVVSDTALLELLSAYEE